MSGDSVPGLQSLAEHAVSRSKSHSIDSKCPATGFSVATDHHHTLMHVLTKDFFVATS